MLYTRLYFKIDNIFFITLHNLLNPFSVRHSLLTVGLENYVVKKSIDEANNNNNNVFISNVKLYVC